MTQLPAFTYAELDIETLGTVTGRVAIVVPDDAKLNVAARRVNRLTKGAVARAVASEAFTKLSDGAVMTLAWPAGMEAEAVDILRLPRRADAALARNGGAALGARLGKSGMTLCLGSERSAADLIQGLALRAYDFTDHKTDPAPAPGGVHVLSTKADEIQPLAEAALAVAEGVIFTRDLVNEPANVLTTTEFATRLEALRDLGVEVEVLDEPELEKLGMRTLLAVGQGSASPSKVVVMRWNGGTGDPLALIGKGVVFDTGGISLKPSAGMEAMTMDMGGAGTVAGTMLALARRRAPANVVGLVGLVENMPSSTAMRPGDVIRSMKGDTVEIISTDAEGRMVLCDVMWYTQEHIKPAAMIDLATLTGACLVALGHEKAAVYANDDALCADFLKAADTTDEGAWRMPLGKAYDDMIKSPIADMKNLGGRYAGSITAAQFLARFVQDGMPWIHLDIAGVAHVPRDLPLSPKGATGWGVRALDQLVRDRYEPKD